MSLENPIDLPAFDLLSDENLGSVVIALAISLVLFGIVSLQGYTYYQSFPNDRLFVKMSAGIVLLLELAHSSITTSIIYTDLVTLRGVSPNGPNSYPSAASIIPAALVTAIVQGFFAFRIYRFSKTPRICAICWFLSLLRLAGGLALTIEAFIDVPRVPNMVTIISTYGWLIALVFIIGAITDVIIAASLCYYLKRLAPCQQFTSTSHLLNRIFLWTIRTGVVTSTASVAIVICFYVKKHAEIWFALYIVTTKLYSNSFFLSLNMRQQLREKRAAESTTSGLHFQDKATTFDSSTREHRHTTVLYLTNPATADLEA